MSRNLWVMMLSILLIVYGFKLNFQLCVLFECHVNGQW